MLEKNADKGYRAFPADGGEYDDYLRDESRKTSWARSISFPRCEEEVRAVLRDLYQQGEVITVQGARTGLTAGAVPAGGHVVNLIPMNQVIGMRVDDNGVFFLRVQPGVVLSQLAGQIEERRFATAGWDETSLRAYRLFREAPPQFFPTDPTERSASLGGMAACNASGARSYRYGAMRRHISGVRMALCGGDLITLRRGECIARGRRLDLPTVQGRVLRLALPDYEMPKCKSAAGYYVEDDLDAVDLLIGSDGTLGVFTELELALTPLPSCIWGATFFFDEEPQALEFVRAARDLGRGELAALEYFDAGVLRLLRVQQRENPAFAALPTPNGVFACAIYCELHCAHAEAAQALLFTLGDAMTRAGGDEGNTWVARTTFDHDKLVFFRHAAPECVNMLIDRRKWEHPALTKLGTDMAVPDAHLEAVMAMYHSALRGRGLEYAIWGHIGNNHVHVNLLPRNEREYAAGRALYAEWARAVVAMGGTVSAEHSIGKLKTDFLALQYGPEHIAQMARIRAQFDPKGLLNRGNLFAPQTQEVEP